MSQLHKYNGVILLRITLTSLPDPIESFNTSEMCKKNWELWIKILEIQRYIFSEP